MQQEQCGESLLTIQGDKGIVRHIAVDEIEVSPGHTFIKIIVQRLKELNPDLLYSFTPLGIFALQHGNDDSEIILHE